MIEGVEIVKIIPKGIWAEKDIMGTVHIYMQNGDDKPFEFITMNYHHHHTSNSHHEKMTRKILALLGVAIDGKQRPYSAAKVCDNALDEHIANAKLLKSASTIKESNAELLDALEDCIDILNSMNIKANCVDIAHSVIAKAKLVRGLSE